MRSSRRSETTPRRWSEKLPVLLDTRTWGDLPVGGNSVQVEARWLDDDRHREAARRLLKALVHGIALFHENRELALDVLQRWNATPGGSPRSCTTGPPFRASLTPATKGFAVPMEVYDSHAMRQRAPEDFYDDSLLKELDKVVSSHDVYAAV